MTNAEEDRYPLYLAEDAWGHVGVWDYSDLQRPDLIVGKANIGRTAGGEALWAVIAAAVPRRASSDRLRSLSPLGLPTKEGETP